MGSITLLEYREILGGRTTLAEVAKRHRADKAQGLPIVLPAQPTGGWLGDLPYPPTVNTYYRHVGPKVLISAKGRRYRAKVARLLAGCTKLCGRLMLCVDVYPPDLRRRDLDNLLKGLQDALVHGGLLADDSDIKRLVMEMHEPKRPDGLVRVAVSRISEQCLDGQSRDGATNDE